MMYNRNPFNISNLQINYISNTSVNLSWYYPLTGLNPIFEYSINGNDFVEIQNIQSFDNVYYNYTIPNLQPYYSYNLNIRAKYLRTGNSSSISFLTSRRVPNTKSSFSRGFFTNKEVGVLRTYNIL